MLRNILLISVVLDVAIWHDILAHGGWGHAEEIHRLIDGRGADRTRTDHQEASWSFPKGAAGTGVAEIRC